MGETTIPVAKPLLVLFCVRYHEVHEVEARTRPRSRSPPGLASLFAVVHRIDDDAATELQIQFRHRASRLVRGYADLPARGQPAREHRLFHRVDGQVNGADECSGDLSDAGLPDPRKTRDHDKMTTHAIRNPALSVIVGNLHLRPVAACQPTVLRFVSKRDEASLDDRLGSDVEAELHHVR